jgi:glycosyltransferase involved in cell wall biosynthesis
MKAASYPGTAGPGLGSPLVSLVMPNLNKGRFIRDAVESVLSQTYGNLELLVVDNGSYDQSLSVIEGFTKKDSRIRLFHEPIRGPAHAITAGIAEARGEFIMVVGSDDVLDHRGVSMQMACLQESGALLCYTEGWVLDEAGKPNGMLYNRDWVRLPASHEGLIFHELIRRVFVLPASVMYSRKCFEYETFDTSLTFGEDWDLLVRLSRHFEFRYVQEPLYGYRIYSGNMMRKGNERLVESNHIRIFEKWLRTLQDLNSEDRSVIFKRLLRSREVVEGAPGMLQVALDHPTASGILLGMAKSSISSRVRKQLRQAHEPESPMGQATDR